MKKIFSVTAMLLICPVFLSGCWDRKEINDLAFVLGTAVDKEGSEYRTSVQIALPGELGGPGGKGSTDGKGWYVESKTGKTIRLSTLESQRSTSREFNVSSRRSLIIGDALAREGIGSILDVFTRTPQNRLLSVVAVAEGPAYKILDTDAPLESFPTEMVRELVLSFTRTPITIRLLLNDLLSEGVDPTLPIIKVDSSVPPKVGKAVKNVKLHGLAILKGDRMVGSLNDEMAKIVIIAMNQNKNLGTTIPAPLGEGTLTVSFTQSNVKLVPVIHGDEVVMKINIKLVGTVSEAVSEFTPSSNMGMLKIQQSVEEKVQSDLIKAMKILQGEYQADSLGFGRAIHHQKPKDWDRLKSRWQDIYPHVQTEIAVNMHLETVGQALEPMGLPEKEIIHD